MASNPILMTRREESTVTAEADSIIDVNLPSHRTILPASVLSELGTSNVAEAVEKVPGVAMVGKGGYSMSPAIRGLAEHRILLLIDGVRITSERRIGASASFINLNNIDHIEVNRGPYSVFHGSGAIGGIINIVSKTPSPGSPFTGKFNLSYNTVRQERAGSANISGSLGKFGLMLAVNGKKADDYKAPSGTVGMSRYSDYDLLMKLSREGEFSQFYITLFHYQGKDIGKPGPTSLLKPRWYPDETNTLFTIGYTIKDKLFLDSLNASVFLMRSSLETQGDNLGEDFSLEKRSQAEIKGTNFGFKIRGSKAFGENHTLNLGFDFFGRGGINDSNSEWRYDESGEVTSQVDEMSLQDARSGNFGLYVDDKIKISPSLTVNIGARWDFLNASNIDMTHVRQAISDQSLTAYIGTEFQVNPHLSLLANLGQSFRFPSVSELFYSGLTGRGTVFGNPDLDPERGLNLDFGFRYLHEKFFASIYGFHNHVRDMIQKFEGEEEEEFFYRNLTQGRIFGVEGELYLAIIKNFEFFMNFHHIKGEEKKLDSNLNFIPPSRLTLWTKYSFGDFWIEPKVTLSASKKDPGPLEIEIDGFTLMDAILGYNISNRLTLLAIFQNIFNQTYRYSADVDGVDAPARGVVIKLSFSL